LTVARDRRAKKKRKAPSRAEVHWVYYQGEQKVVADPRLGSRTQKVAPWLGALSIVSFFDADLYILGRMDTIFLSKPFWCEKGIYLSCLGSDRFGWVPAIGKHRGRRLDRGPCRSEPQRSSVCPSRQASRLRGPSRPIPDFPIFLRGNLGRAYRRLRAAEGVAFCSGSASGMFPKVG
jgi:hypothetical protein